MASRVGRYRRKLLRGVPEMSDLNSLAFLGGVEDEARAGGPRILTDSNLVQVPREALEVLLASYGSASKPPLDFEPKRFLSEFEQACEVDYRLRSATIKEHLRHVRRLLDFLGMHPSEATRTELRQFLTLDKAVNAIKAVRVLYGKFLDSDLAKCFKIPQSVPRIIIVPTREVLTQTYWRLKTLEMKAAFLMFASSGLRRHELMELIPSQIDMEKGMVMPTNDPNPTKFQWVTFFNDEAKTVLEKLLYERLPSPNERIFTMHEDTPTKVFKRASDSMITPKILRSWFCNELGRLGVQDRYIDALCGRVPKSVLARHYTDYSPERLKEVYDKANLRVLGQAGFEPAMRAEAAA